MANPKKSFKKKSFKKQQPKGVNKFLPRDKQKVEKKSLDTSARNVACDNVGTIVPLNVIGQGTGLSGRIGNRINLKSVQMRCLITGNTSTVPFAVRVMLVYDRQPNGLLAVLTQAGTNGGSHGILDTQSLSGTTVCNTTEPLFLPNRNRFTVLMDKVIDCQPQFSTDVVFKSVQKYKKINTYAEYNGSAANMNTINVGALYFIYYSTQATGSSLEPIMNYSCRVRYTDE